MKKLFLALFALSLLAAPAHAAQVRGYFKKDGTYVAPHSSKKPRHHSDRHHHHR